MLILYYIITNTQLQVGMHNHQPCFYRMAVQVQDKLWQVIIWQTMNVGWPVIPCWPGTVSSEQNTLNAWLVGNNLTLESCLPLFKVHLKTWILWFSQTTPGIFLLHLFLHPSYKLHNVMLVIWWNTAQPNAKQHLSETPLFALGTVSSTITPSCWNASPWSSINFK